MKQTNEQIYIGLMALRASEPKRFFFLRLQEKYDCILLAFQNGKKKLLDERVTNMNDWLHSSAPLYGITAAEIKRYFVENNMSINFKL